MTETIKQQLSEVKKRFDKTRSNTEKERKIISNKIEVLVKFIPRYEKSWVGNWTENPNRYYNNFDTSSEQGITIDEKSIWEDLIELSGIDFYNLKSRIPSISEQFFELREFILSELSFINDIDIFKNESELLKQIEGFTWGMNPGDYSRSRQPRYAIVYDPSIINKGIPTPPHIKVSDDLITSFSLFNAYDNFEKLAHRLIRQLEIKSSTSSEAETGIVFQQNSLIKLIDKFHSVSTQLKNRYNNRQTISIDDEYDTQDLMNALLRINFEDVRKEEYTPSYAGSSARIDFLLKREQILIEVKKTRPTLKDKEIGNQLIIDIAHYKSHPDCKHLICFVYDPDNLIVNPRGLEDDLNRNTTEEMIVEVYIRP